MIKKKNIYYYNIINNNINNIKKVYQILNQILGRVTLSIDELITKAFEAQNLISKRIADNSASGFDREIKKIIPSCSLKFVNGNSNYKPLNASILYKNATCDKIHKIISGLNSQIRTRDIIIITA